VSVLPGSLAPSPEGGATLPIEIRNAPKAKRFPQQASNGVSLASSRDWPFISEINMPPGLEHRIEYERRLHRVLAGVEEKHGRDRSLVPYRQSQAPSPARPVQLATCDNGAVGQAWWMAMRSPGHVLRGMAKQFQAFKGRIHATAKGRMACMLAGIAR